MKIIEKNGNLLDSNAPIICHQVNCKGIMGAGLAKQIRHRFPSVYDAYRNAYECGKLFLGNVIFANVLENNKNQVVANLCGQNYYGRTAVYTDYNAVRTCLENVKAYALNHKLKLVAIPHGMSCGLAGGKWDKIFSIIKEVFCDTDIDIEIYSFRG